MKQLMSLLKAVMSQDMNLFKIRTKTNSSGLKKLLFPIMMAGIFMFAIGTYLYIFAVELSKVNLTYIMLTFALILPTIFTVVEGIYKSQGMLFETKDNDLLFSLPIKKSKILFVRLIKLWAFQYMYNLLFVIPAFAIYIFFEHPGISFYAISIIMSFLLPIIPTIVACFIGFIIKNIAVRFKSKKITQTILTTIVFVLIFYISFNMNNIIGNLIENASNINDLLIKIYYPIGAYISLIQKFEIVEFLKLIMINAIPLILFIIIATKYYFKIISKSSEKSIGNKQRINNKKRDIKEKSKLSALISKELKRYFSSTVYMLNTLFGIVLMLVITIAICVNLNGTITMITEGEDIGIDINQIIQMLPKVFYGLVIFISCMTSITSSSISLEGKSFNITKSLPIKTEQILLAKILTSNIISIPIIILSDIIFFIAFKTGIFDTISILLISIIMPTITAIIGLFANLKYPKMNATSDTEVVKQSMSSMVSVFGGMFIAFALIGFIIGTLSVIGVNLSIIIELVVLIIVMIILWETLKRYGEKKFKKINV